MLLARIILFLQMAFSANFAFAGEAEWKAQMNAGESARRAGDYHAAAAILERALREAELFDAHDPRLAATWHHLAVVYRMQGRYADAEPLLKQALAARENAFGQIHMDVGESLNALAIAYHEQGRYAEAESLYQRTLSIVEKLLGPDHSIVSALLGNLASLFTYQGRYATAEPLFRRAISIREKSLGQNSPVLAALLGGLANLYLQANQLGAAEPLFQRSLELAEKGFGPEDPRLALALNGMAVLRAMQGRYMEAAEFYRRDLSISLKTFGHNHPNVAITLHNIAKLYYLQKRYADTEQLLQRSLAITENVFGSNHPTVLGSLSELAFAYQAQGKTSDALTTIRRVNSSLTAHLYSNISNRKLLPEQRKASGHFGFHVLLLAEQTNKEPQLSIKITNESFSVAQLARPNDTANQLANMAARHAAGNDALAQLARMRQDTLARFEQLDSQIIQAAGQRGAEALAAKLRTEQAETLKAITDLDARLERDYPQYRELTNPKPLELAAAQKLLAKDEALVLLLVSADESFLWVLRQSNAGFFKLAIKRSELADAVKKLRAQLDLGAGNPESMLARPFDVAAAHELYRKILAPAEPLLAGAKHLIFIPDGAVQSLPPGVLVTAPPAKPVASLADHAQVAWLAKQYAITVLPAAGSLRALRQFGKAPASREPFGGFGDPLLGSDGKAARNAPIPALYSRGAVADVNEVRKLSRLPESADELRAIARALNAPAASIRLGAAATERAVKEADLTRYRNLAFATHGLMAGDFKGLAEPALVFTPPEKGSELDDGLLTASEISQLKLDADWVVLSACNTAAPDGTPGAEGLSGLARAFFYAGARSLLVSHWAVDTDAAVALTTRMFDEAAKGATKAEALQRSMLALMARADKPHYAHPALWAPFVVVGEGNTRGLEKR